MHNLVALPHVDVEILSSIHSRWDFWVVRLKAPRQQRLHKYTKFTLGSWAIQARLLTPLTFVRHRLSPLAAFTSGAYFLHNGRRWQWICEFYTANFKGIVEARSHNVSGNKQELFSRAIGCPKRIFFYELTIFWSAPKRRKDTFLPSSIPFSR